MARIRSLKPEMWGSESIGRLSRDARLLFIGLITQVDDEGRIRASSRGLASLLLPFDDDVAGQVDGWLSELEAEGMFRRYMVDGSTYGEIPKFILHQKIDHPSASKLPAYRASLAIPREASRILAPDQGSRIKDQGEDLITVAAAPESKPARKTQEVFGPEIQTNTGKSWQLPLTTAKRHMTAYGYNEAELIRQLERIAKHKAELPEGKRPGFGGMHTIVESWLSKHSPGCAATEVYPRVPKLSSDAYAAALEVQNEFFPKESA